MRVVEEIQREVWGLDDRDIVPVTQLVAARHAGGQLIGARDGRTLVGFVYGFVGLEEGRTTHHSHMLAVKPAYRGRDVGYRLKLAQRERVLAQGITRITWTFDPLQSVNAYFNFCKLGVVSDAYKIDFYGETSSVLHRVGTDRLWVTWLLDSERVKQRLEGVGPAILPAAGRIAGATPRPGEAFIEIPSDINSVQKHDPEQASRWRDVTRRAFTEAFAAGFHVADFFRRESVGVYVLRQGRPA